MMMPTGSAEQAGKSPAHQCKMMDMEKPDKPSYPDAGHDHFSDSGPFSAAVFAQGRQTSPTFYAEQVPSKEASAPLACEVVVKFKDDTKVKDIIDAFWKDRAISKAKFEMFREGRPEMAASSLARVTYSGELVLAYPCETSSPAARFSAMREAAARLTAAPDIAYAEPDMTAHPQH
jgi:hypothetical protein